MVADMDRHTFIELTADIVSAYVSNNAIPTNHLKELISSIYGALTGLDENSTSIPSPQLKPAVSPKKSVTDNYIICLEDGRMFKSLKRHISTHYNLSPSEYRARWNLPADYPMVAPAYAAARSALAKASGLGRKKVEAPLVTTKRGRKKSVPA